MTATAQRTRTFAWADPAAMAAVAATKSGLEYLSDIAAGHAPPPPIADLLGLTLEIVEPGRVVFAVRTGRVDVQPHRQRARRDRGHAA